MTTVILPFRNGRDLVVEQFDALLRQDFDEPWELILVDNRSTDGTTSLIEPKLRVERTSGPTRVVLDRYDLRAGHASPRNHGVQIGSGDSLVFCDADDLVADGWLAALVAVGREHGFVASNVVPLEARPLSGQPEAEAASFAGGQLPTKFGLPVVHTCGMYCSRELFEKLGGFDPYFDIGGADVDFSIRALRAGYSPERSERALYFFRKRPTSASAFRQGYRYGRSGVRLYERHRDFIGVPPSPWSLIAHRVVDALRRSPRLLSPDTRRWYLAELGRHTAGVVWSARLRIRHF